MWGYIIIKLPSNEIVRLQIMGTRLLVTPELRILFMIGVLKRNGCLVECAYCDMCCERELGDKGIVSSPKNDLESQNSFQFSSWCLQTHWTSSAECRPTVDTSYACLHLEPRLSQCSPSPAPPVSCWPPYLHSGTCLSCNTASPAAIAPGDMQQCTG